LIKIIRRQQLKSRYIQIIEIYAILQNEVSAAIDIQTLILQTLICIETNKIQNTLKRVRSLNYRKYASSYAASTNENIGMIPSKRNEIPLKAVFYRGFFDFSYDFLL